MLNHAMQGVRQLINHNKHPHNTADANPFGKALDTPDDIQRWNSRTDKAKSNPET